MSTDPIKVYDDVLVPRLLEPWVAALLDRLALARNEALIDVATGPGTVTRAAAERVGPGGAVTGCDVSAEMLAVAADKPLPAGSAAIEYEVCSAETLTAADRSFDVLTCQQGLQFFPDRAGALAEMHRVLRPGGRLGLAVWCDVDQSPPFAAVATAVDRVLGAGAGVAYRGGPWGLADPELLVALVRGAGFRSVRVEREVVPVVFERGASQLLSTLVCTPVAAQIAELDSRNRRRLYDQCRRALRPFTVDGAVVSETASHIVTARK
ncbi:MAG: class I SAM-dependent methyltransferase [Acidimicrobiia bacterium]|nr:class I SAM-dependent methyltransferase [Acidimicrobiia bacterium]